MASLMEKVKALPALPGCYIYKNINNDIIYVGKSKCLKKRVSQYFQGMDKKEGRLLHLVKEIRDFEYIVTETETDALLLECKLIKQHMPYYNILMKRTRKYPYISIKLSEDYPGIYTTLEAEEQGAVSFGCFYNLEDAEGVIMLINSVWRTPICNSEYFMPSTKKRECFSKQLKKCDAPCEGVIDKEEYQRRIREIIRFLRGDNKKILSDIRKEMLELSKYMEFEKAAVLRNRMNLMTELKRRTKKFHTDLRGRDFCIFLRAYNEECFSIFYVHDSCAVHKVVYEYGKVLAEADFEGFSRDIIEKKKTLEDGVVIAMCITKIGADKWYVDVDACLKRKSMEALSRKLYANYKEYHK